MTSLQPPSLDPQPSPESKASVAVYRYGLLPPTVHPEKVSEQLSLAHAYQNKLVELERARRTARDEILAKQPALAEIDRRLAELQAALALHSETIGNERSEARDKRAGDTTAVKNVREEMRVLWKKRKEELKTALALPHIVDALAVIQADFRLKIKAERAVCGVFWGTYTQIERAAEQASGSPTPPRFQRWTGDGSIGIQIITPAGQGAKQEVAKVLNGENTSVRISPQAQSIPGRMGKSLHRLLLRIGSEGRDPIFAEWPIILHRPLPEGSLVKAAKVVRRRIGAHDNWSVHFTLVLNDSKTSEEDKAIAVNLRWARTTLDGEATTLAADYTSDIGKGDISVAPEVVSQLRKSDDLRSIRDKNFDKIRGELSPQLKILTLPEEMKSRLEFMHAWKAQGKLAATVIWWRHNRFEGDATAFALAEAWRKQDKHLWDWEANSRRKALARRKDSYRVFAAQAARKHHVLVIEKINLARLAKKPELDEERDFNAKASAQRFATAPSELRSALLNAFRREGGRVVEVAAGYTSREMLAMHLTAGIAIAPVKTGQSERTKRMLKNKGKEKPLEQTTVPI